MFTLEAWQALGYDKHSVFTDPYFINAKHDDIRLNRILLHKRWASEESIPSLLDQTRKRFFTGMRH